jgi:hypothetical protein
VGKHNVGRKRGQFRRKFGNGIGMAAGPADVDADIAAVAPAELLQALCEGVDASLNALSSAARGMSTPTRRTAGCAPAASGHAAAPSSVMNSRRRIAWLGLESVPNSACNLVHQSMKGR